MEEVTSIQTSGRVAKAFEYLEIRMNEPIGRMKYEENRLDSFCSYWPNFHQTDVSVAQRLVRAGFYLTGGTRSTVCFSCGLRGPLAYWLQGHDPETVHHEKSPNCQFINGQRDNVAIGDENLNNSQFTSLLQDPTVRNPSRNQGDANKRTHKFNYKLLPSGTQTWEPDSTPATHQQQHLPSISSASTTGTRNPDGSVQVSASMSFCYPVVLGKIMEFA